MIRRKSDNEIFVLGNVALIKLEKKDGSVLYSVIDVEDIEKISGFRWCDGGRYCVAYVGKKTLFLHRVITDNKFAIVDHANGDGLDNRKCNLREATVSENAWNSKKYKNNTSGHIGICYCTTKKGKNHYWRVQVGKDGKGIKKCFPYTDKGLKQAIEFRDKMKLELHKEFARLK